MGSSEQPFAAFYGAAKDRVFQAVLASVRNPARAEDAVADAFLKAYERWESVGHMENPTAWVVRVALNRYRSDWRIWRREVPEPPPAHSVSDEFPLDAAIIHLVWRLPARQREVVALRVLTDLSEHDTAVALGISPKTVSVHLHRALEKLRAGLEPMQKEEQRWTTQDLPAK
jgi:RNA polymerase sigma factor (sigma-70 family)